MAGITIRADGVDWPLETFIDCYRMVRHDRSYPRIAATSAAVNFVNEAGQFQERKPANTVYWGEVVAYSLPDGYICPECSLPTEVMWLQNSRETCYDCTDDDEW